MGYIFAHNSLIFNRLKNNLKILSKKLGSFKYYSYICIQSVNKHLKQTPFICQSTKVIVVMEIHRGG